eukprot:366079-Chlamydomonas_euryale.AAC.4
MQVWGHTWVQGVAHEAPADELRGLLISGRLLPKRCCLLQLRVRTEAKWGGVGAPKTEVMVIGRPMTTFKLSGKELLVTEF